MATAYTVRVHFIDGSERIVPAFNIHDIGDEGAKSANALVDGCEVPIYNDPEWGFLWYGQERQEGSEDSALPEWAKE